MSGTNSIRQVSTACVRVGTLIALPGGFRVIKAALHDVFGLTSWTLDAIRPAQLADGLLTWNIIDHILDIDLHGWTPVRDGGMASVYTVLNSTPLESNMSLLLYQYQRC